MKSLFGEHIPDIPIQENKHMGWCQAWKLENKYRLSISKDMRCKNCKNLKACGRNKRYYKCAKLGCSASESTDIRVGHVCNLYEHKSLANPSNEVEQ